MKRILAIGLLLALGVGAAYASREKIHIHFTYGYTGARGLKVCTAFVYQATDPTPTLRHTIVLDGNGAPPLTSYDTVVHTNILDDWKIIIRVTDSNNINTPAEYSVTTRSLEYTRWGTPSY